jgi:hypothetical protein
MEDSRMGESTAADGPIASPRGVVAAAIALLCASVAGCSSPARPYLEKDMTLSQAGFVAHQADTTARYAMMNTLPPGQLTYRPSPVGPVYLYADPIGCGCVYMGSETAYRAFRGLTTGKRNKRKPTTSAQQDIQAMAAENRRDTALWDWSAWSSNADPGGDQPRHVIGGYW